MSLSILIKSKSAELFKIVTIFGIGMKNASKRVQTCIVLLQWLIYMMFVSGSPFGLFLAMIATQVKKSRNFGLFAGNPAVFSAGFPLVLYFKAGNPHITELNQLIR